MTLRPGCRRRTTRCRTSHVSPPPAPVAYGAAATGSRWPPGAVLEKDRTLDSYFGVRQYWPMSIFEVLAEPKRREILDLLLDGERPAGAIVAVVGLSQPTVSQHLKVLREAGLVVVRPDANRRFYRLRPAALSEIEAWLEPYRREWARRLDALERHLDNAVDPQPSEGDTP